MPNEILSTPSGSAPPNGDGSIDTIRHAVHGVRAALAALLESAGVDATKTRESARLLNLNRGMVWRVSRVVGAEDDVTAATHIPGPVGIERLIDACRGRGVQDQLLDSLRSRVREFHDVVESHSGDRRTLEILLANAGGTQSTSLDLESARKALFDGGCAVWGVRADVRLRCGFITPNPEDPTMLDDTGIGGYVGFRRLRQVSWPMSYKAAYKDTGDSDSPREETIEEDAGNSGGLSLLREFCFPPDLSIQTVTNPRATRHELPPSVDLASQPVTCTFGAIFRKIYTARQTPDCRIAGALLVLDTPVERVVFDVFVHRSLGMSGPPEVRLLDRLTRPHGFHAEDLETETLPLEHSPRRLGPGSAGAVTPHIPWYPRLIERVCQRLGFRSDEFIAHRIEVVYPPIPTALVAQFRLPPQA